MEDSDLVQRDIERRAGFGRGYLSQLLRGTIDLKYWHVISVVRALDRNPGEFFAALYPPRSRRDGPISPETAAALRLNADVLRLYAMGIESVQALRGRLDICESELRRLLAEGIVDGG